MFSISPILGALPRLEVMFGVKSTSLVYAREREFFFRVHLVPWDSLSN